MIIRPKSQHVELVVFSILVYDIWYLDNVAESISMVSECCLLQARGRRIFSYIMFSMTV
jgi:hypothetical protein